MPIGTQQLFGGQDPDLQGQELTPEVPDLETMLRRDHRHGWPRHHVIGHGGRDARTDRTPRPSAVDPRTRHRWSRRRRLRR